VRLQTGVAVTLSIVLGAAACGRSKDSAAGATAAATPSASAVDTSTADDWKANCAARHHYRNGLIFTATESTENGQKALALSTSRAPYLAAFAGLRLDGVPELKAQREQLLAMAEKTPGGNRIHIGPQLGQADRGLWEAVMRAAMAHGVDCQALEK
jgi:hypothetical protein